MSRVELPCLFLMVVLFATFTHGRDCDFDGTCNWNIKFGFTISTFADLNSSYFNEGLNVKNFLENSTGKFAFYNPDINGDKGRIRTPRLPAVRSGYDICLDILVFTGSRAPTGFIGVLKATVVTDSEEDFKKINLTPNDLQKWTKFNLLFNNPGTSYKLVIDVTLADRAGAFVALDDITVRDCIEESLPCEHEDTFPCDSDNCISWSRVCNLQKECPDGRDEDPKVCGSLPKNSSCTFDNDTCDWHNVVMGDHIDWIRYRNSTPTQGTGPTADHTTGTGYYMYIESSDGSSQFDNAVLESSVMPDLPKGLGEPHHCKLRFFYHMTGSMVEDLKVRLIDLCLRYPIPRVLWERRNDQGPDWLYAEVNIPDTVRKHVIQFVGYGSIQNHGDIAIDDVTFSPGCYGIGHNKTNFTTLEEAKKYKPMTRRQFNEKKKEFCAKKPPATTIDNLTSTFTEEPVVIGNNSKPTSESITRDEAASSDRPEEKFDVIYIITIICAAVVLTVVLGTAVLCLALRRRSLQSNHLEMASNQSDDNCNGTLIPASTFDMQLRCAVTELNPNYDFITAKYPEQQLREIPRNKLTMIRLLGQGAFGEVYEGRLHNMCANVKELPVAVKTLPALSTEQAERDFLMEAVIISKFMHKNVVKCLGVCFEEHPRYIILELLEGGDLKTFLRDSRPKHNQKVGVTMEELVKLALDIANGCRHLEEKHFIHRDIAARNCLLTSRRTERVAKIADFGMSRDIYSADYYRKGGKTMLPIKWMPPEAFLDGVFTTKTDVWSFGVLLWEIFTLGYMPYPGQTNSDVMHFVASGGRLDPPDNSPARLNKIMIMCWNCVADIRPCFNEIIEHLDMCLQDSEVMEADPSDFYLPAKDCFKDASTLASGATSGPHKNEASASTPGTNDAVAEFGRHVESQSREPLLPQVDEND